MILANDAPPSHSQTYPALVPRACLPKREGKGSLQTHPELSLYLPVSGG